MKVEGEYTFDGPRETVWDLLLDPEVLSRALPGNQKLELTEPDRYEGTMQVQIGPVTAGVFSVSVTVGDKVHPESYTMSVEGRGGIGFTRGTATVRLEAPEPERTLMKYEASLQIGGRVASVGQRLLDSVGKSLTRHGLESLSRELQQRIADAT
ncbi:MAG: CoxG family protein [Gemmatimonadota bacterium]